MGINNLILEGIQVVVLLVILNTLLDLKELLRNILKELRK